MGVQNFQVRVSFIVALAMLLVMWPLMPVAAADEDEPRGQSRSAPPGVYVAPADQAFDVQVHRRNQYVEREPGSTGESGGERVRQIEHPSRSTGSLENRNIPRNENTPGDRLSGLLSNRNFCTNSGASDPSCWDLLPRDCPVGFLIGGLAAGGPAECPSTDEEPVELAVAPPAPDQTEAAEEIPAHELVYTTVVEEFSRLPIDGGRVAFEEQLQGFGYINRHTNVFADVETQTLTEELLGHTVQIRAIPVEYTFDYGDGTVRTTSRAGESVAHFAETNNSINLTDAETPTSHIYSSTGVYPVQVTTRFIGEFQVEDSGWIAIPGSTTAAASPGEADIWRTSQRLVSGACRDATDYGCNGPFTIEPGDRPPAIYQDRYDEDGNWLGR